MANDAQMLDALRATGLLGAGEAARVEALTGGVSSDVVAVRMATGAYVVKRSIPKLRVKADWRAPVSRAASEVAWLRFVGGLDARLAPTVLAWIPEQHLFVMPLLDPASHPVWKAEMAAGRVDPAFAEQVGRDLARIHGAAAGRADLAKQFGDITGFMALRIDPFLLFTAERHPDVAPRLRALADGLASRKTTLVQGDISPKNILVGPAGPVFLDAECAVWGDGAFDLAFCLTHLLLKSIWLPDCWRLLLESFERLSGTYLAAVAWEDAGALSRRAAALTGALLLARVDGKSPAGYLDEPAEHLVRARAKAILGHEDWRLADLVHYWRGERLVL
jgi:aminoglycoside phosphotransferase (APT) family kinase protein